MIEIRMASAKSNLKDYFESHVGEDIDRDTLRSVAGGISDWPRVLRQMRQETGYDIVPTKTGYIMKSAEPKYPPRIRGNVNLSMRARVLRRDKSTCQMCGANPKNTPGVKLVIDHIIPVEQGGKTTFDNLQTLCRDCNAGKKDKFKGKPKVRIRQRIWGALRAIKNLIITLVVLAAILGALYFFNKYRLRFIDPKIIDYYIDKVVSLIKDMLSNSRFAKSAILFEHGIIST